MVTIQQVFSEVTDAFTMVNNRWSPVILTTGLGWVWLESLHKNIQLMLELLKAPLWVLHFSYCTLMAFLMLFIILLSMLMILLSTLKCHQASNLWQKLELAFELGSDLQDTVDWGRNWLNVCWKNSTVFIWPVIDVNWVSYYLYCYKCLFKNCCDSFYKIFFFWGCPISVKIYHTAMHGILLSCLGSCS